MHHLINELRPHQARESIRVLMQSQKRQRFETTARLNKQIERVNDLMTTAINSITEQTLNPSIDIQHKSSETSFTNESTLYNSIDSKSDEICDLDDKCYKLDALMCEFVDDI